MWKRRLGWRSWQSWPHGTAAPTILRMHHAEVQLNSIPTPNAVAAYYKADSEWCRLSDLFHRIVRSDTPKLKTRARAKMDKREADLLTEILWGIGQGEILVYLQSKPSEELELPGLYAGSINLPNALRTGRASSLGLRDADACWVDARLVLERDNWNRWFHARKEEPQADSSMAVGNVDKPTLHGTGPGDGPLRASQTAATAPKKTRTSLAEAARQWFEKSYPSGPGAKMNETIARECGVALGRKLSERTMRRAMGRR